MMLGREMIRGIKTGNIFLVKECLLAGLDVNYRDEKGVSILNWAALTGKVELVLLLIEKGVDTQNIVSALQCAARGGYTNIVSILLNIGSEIKKSELESILFIAVENGCRSVVAVLIQEGRFNIHSVTHPVGGDTVLIYLIKSPFLAIGCRTSMVYMLLELGVGINAQDHNWKTALHHAATQCHEVIRLLLEHGADPFIRDKNGKIPLHCFLSQPDNNSKKLETKEIRLMLGSKEEVWDIVKLVVLVISTLSFVSSTTETENIWEM